MAKMQKITDRNNETIRVLRAARDASEETHGAAMAEQFNRLGKQILKLKGELATCEEERDSARRRDEWYASYHNEKAKLAACEDGSNGVVGSGVGTT